MEGTTSKVRKAPVQQKPVQDDPERVVRQFDETPPGKEAVAMNRTVVIVYVVLLVLGIGTGYLLAGTAPGGGGIGGGTPEVIDTGKVVGSTDNRTFKDSAEGKLEKGGVDGEGTHHLVRDGGPSQNVYLTSSVVDLDEFVGQNVKVWGQTISAQKAGWLMDVGKVERQ